jgi:arylsulfatase A-like enzyme
VSFLKARHRFDNSIIIITGDHGDSLGENGHWGHAMWLFPEDVSVPLIVHIPEALRPGLTTDLTRLTFTTDIAPTIYALRYHPVRDLGPLFGAPLFVPQGQTLADRRRESFLLTSSYGPTFGLLRRNGQFLYVTDLLEWRDFAYDLARSPAEQPMVIDRDLRSLNEREIRARLDDLASLYHITW